MSVTDEQVAALRSYVAADVAEEWVSLHDQLRQDGGLDDYGTLVTAAFVTAVRRKFSPTWTLAAVIRFVASARATISEKPDLIEPRAAENLIRRALGDTVTDTADLETKTRAQLLLLVALIQDEQLDDIGLDAFLVDARTLADQISRDKEQPRHSYGAPDSQHPSSPPPDQPGAPGRPSRAASRAAAQDSAS